MNDRSDFKSQLISSQKPRKRRRQHVKNKTDRRSIDLIGLHEKVVETTKRRKSPKTAWIGAALFLVALPGFFILGCSIAAMSASVWVKALLVIPIAVLGFIVSYILAVLLYQTGSDH